MSRYKKGPFRQNLALTCVCKRTSSSMPPYTPNTNLWLERSRLAGMILAAVTYGKFFCDPSVIVLMQSETSLLLLGIFFLLTIQTNAVLIRRPRRDSQTTRHRWMLLGYVWITFSLATIGFAGNARYTEMIWIDLRSTPGGPAVLILGEMNYPVNMMASTWYVFFVFPDGYCHPSRAVIATTLWSGLCKLCWSVSSWLLRLM